jgi:hypothetical protein
VQIGTKPAVENCRSITAGGWVRAGIIRPGVRWSGSVHWRDGETGEVLASIGVEARADEDGTGLVRLRYTVTRHGEKEPVDLSVRLTSVPRYFGGRQWYFVCPLAVKGTRCGRRACKLYLRSGCSLFGCRVCLDLRYRSSQEAHAVERRERVLGQLAARYGGVRRLMNRVDQLSPGELLALIRAID